MKTLKDIQAVSTVNIDDLSLSEINELLAAGKQLLISRRKRQQAAGINAAVWKKHNPYKINTHNQIRRDQTGAATQRAVMNRAKSQLIDVIYTLNLQTTTVKGYKQWAHRQAMIGNKKHQAEVDAKILDKAWTLFERWHQYAPSLASNLGSPVTFKLIRDYVTEHGPKKITIGDISEMMRKVYGNMDGVEYTKEQWTNMIKGGL